MTGIRFTDQSGKIVILTAPSDKKLRGLYDYACRVATIDMLIEHVIDGVVIASHQSSWELDPILKDSIKV